MSGRGSKITNEYAQSFGRLYANTPKAVFAAVAFSLAFINTEEKGSDVAVAAFLEEWRILNANGIVPQKAPDHA